MKTKELFLGACVAISIVMVGCQSKASGNSNTMAQQNIGGDPALKVTMTGVTMIDGRAMIVWGDGKTTALQDADVTMSNGVKVTSDGKVVMKDGASVTMGNGDTVMMDGTIKAAAEVTGR